MSFLIRNVVYRGPANTVCSAACSLHFSVLGKHHLKAIEVMNNPCYPLFFVLPPSSNSTFCFQSVFNPSLAFTSPFLLSILLPSFYFQFHFSLTYACFCNGIEARTQKCEPTFILQKLHWCSASFPSHLFVLSSLSGRCL